MKTVKRAMWSVLVLVLSQQWLCVQTEAIPPFARKYGTSCQTCHVIIPKLNAFGEAFRLNGYKIPDAEAALVKDEPAVLGAPAWQRLFPQAMWPSTIPGLPPVGFRVISDIQWTHDKTASARWNFIFPDEVTLLMGGRFDDHFGFLTEVEFVNDGGEISPEIGQAYLFVNDFMSWAHVPEHALSVRIGLMDMQLLLSHNEPTQVGKTAPLWSGLSLGDWKLLNGTEVFSSGNAFLFEDAEAAVELNGILARRFYWGAGLATGSGNTDVNTHKDVYYKVKYKPFGRDFLGTFSPNAEVSLGGKASGGWVDNGLLLEHFGYFGLAPADDQFSDRFWYLGGAARWSWQNLDLAGGYVLGRHNRPFGAASDQEIEIRTWFGKAEYMFFPWLMGRVLYEGANVDKPSAPLALAGPADFGNVGYDGSLTQQRIMFGPVFSLRANIRLALEAEMFLQHEGAELVHKTKPDNYWVRLDFAY